MTVRTQKVIPFVLFLPGALFGLVGIQQNAMSLMAFVALLLLVQAIFKLCSSVNRRRANAARYGVQAMSAALLLILSSWISWSIAR